MPLPSACPEIPVARLQAALAYYLANRAEVQSLHDRWEGAGANIVSPPAAKPYKLFEFFAKDLDGNILRVFYDFAWEETNAAVAEGEGRGE